MGSAPDPAYKCGHELSGLELSRECCNYFEVVVYIEEYVVEFTLCTSRFTILVHVELCTFLLFACFTMYYMYIISCQELFCKIS